MPTCVSKFGYGIALLIALCFFYMGVTRVLVNSYDLFKWLRNDDCGISRWEWRGFDIQRDDAVDNTVFPPGKKTTLIILNAKPVVAVITDDGDIPPYVRRASELDGAESDKIGHAVIAFVGIDNPFWHFAMQVIGSLVICTLAVFIGGLAIYNMINRQVMGGVRNLNRLEGKSTSTGN